MMPKLVIWDRAWASLQKEFARRLEGRWRVVAAADQLEWLLREIEDAAALLAIRMPPEARPLARQLEVFLFPGAGPIQTDPESVPAGCPVVIVHEHQAPIAEYVLMSMLLHATKMLRRLETFRQGLWDGSGRVGGEPHEELAGKTLGIIGFGRIGQAVAMRAAAFGMEICSYDGERNREALESVLRRSRYLVIAAPLNKSSRGMIGAAELALLPPGAFLVNVSRAEIVDEDALYEALVSGRLGGAALDVWYQYPAAGERGHGSRHPFHKLPNVYCTPHFSAWTNEMIHRRIDRMCENLLRLSRGEPLENIVMVGTWKT